MGVGVRRVVATKLRARLAAVPGAARLRRAYRAFRRPPEAAPETSPSAVSGDAPALSVDNNAPGDEFHSILHRLRTAELCCVPKGARRVVSVGASGRWYFEWFEDCVGPLELHVGVEAFEEQPDDLPANVEWVPSTADDMSSIGDDSIDLVFAGQTTEHLWPTELVGFLSEAARVLRPGGLLVVDSPNRLGDPSAALEPWRSHHRTVCVRDDRVARARRISRRDVHRPLAVSLRRRRTRDSKTACSHEPTLPNARAVGSGLLTRASYGGSTLGARAAPSTVAYSRSAPATTSRRTGTIVCAVA